MDGSSVTLDKVEIQISASAGAASDNITSLTTCLSNLKAAVKGGFNNLSKLATSLEQLKSASRGMGQVTKNLGKLDSITSSLKQIGEIPNPKGLQKAIDNLERLPSVFENINGGAIGNVTRVSNELSQALTPLANKLADIGKGYSAINQLANRYGVSVTKIKEYTEQTTNKTSLFSKSLSALRNGLKVVQKQNELFFKGFSKNAKKIGSFVKQIGLSLLGTRTIFTATRKAISEYMSMDAELTWQIGNNWRALGAQLAPAVEYIVYLFKQFVRVIYSVILALTGIDLIARANEKAMKGWGKAAKDTLGNLQKFDDLNVVEFPKSSGDDNSLIELDTIDLSPIQKVIDWVRKLRDEIKEAWNSGEWYGVGEVLAEGLNAALDVIDFNKIEKKFEDIAKKFGDFLKGVVDNFDWTTFGTQLTRQLSLIPRLISTALNNIPWEEIGNHLNETLTTFDSGYIVDSIFAAITSLIDGVQKAFLKIDGKKIANQISKIFISLFSDFDKLINTIEWGSLGDKIKETLLNIEWAEIATKILEVVKDALGGIFELFGLGEIETSLQSLYTSMDAFNSSVGEGLKWIYDNLLVPLYKYTVNKLIPEFIDTLSSAVELLDNIIQGATPSITFLWDNFLNPLLDITEMIILDLLKMLNGLFKDFSNWASANQQTVELITDIFISFLAGLYLYLAIRKIPYLIGLLSNMLGEFGLAKALSTLNIPLIIAGVGLGALIYSIIEIGKHWDEFNGLEKVISVLSALVIAATTAAIAVGALQSAWSLGIAAAAITAGIIAITYSVTNATKRAKSELDSFTKMQAAGSGGSMGAREYETGGFPEKGQYFYARENGIPEFVGRIGNQTAVANNDQIVTAIQQGVEVGVGNALNNDDSMSPTIVVNLGNDTLYKRQQKYNRRQNDKYGTDVNL